MSYEQLSDGSFGAFEADTLHHPGSLGPLDARLQEMGMSTFPEQQQRQRRQQELSGVAMVSMYLDGGPVAFFTPHGYHAPGSGRQSDRHIL